MLLFEFLWSGVMIQFRQNENNYAICYYRYSSHSQNEASIEQQQKAAHRYAKEHGYFDTAILSLKRREFSIVGSRCIHVLSIRL